MLISRMYDGGSCTYDFIEVRAYGTCHVTGTNVYSGEEMGCTQLRTLAEEGYFTLEVRGYHASELYWHGFTGQELFLSCAQTVLDGLLIDCIEQPVTQDIPIEYPEDFEKMYVFSKGTRRIFRAVAAESEQLVLRKRGDEMYLVSISGYRDTEWEPLIPIQLWKLLSEQSL